jgi:transposase
MENYGELVSENTLLKEKIQLLIQRDELLQQENQLLKSNLFKFEQELEFLKRQLFGRKSERYVPTDNAQLNLSLEGIELKELPVQTEQINYQRKKPGADKKQPVRLELPAHLRREEKVIEPETDLTGAIKIGEVITEVLEYTAGEVHVTKYIRNKYVLPAEKGIVIGELPSLPLPKANAGASLLSHIIISKFVDHLPFYRQVQQFKRQGVTIAESTISGWFNGVGDLLEPLYEKLKERIRQCDYLQADETPIQVKDPLRQGKTHRGYYWVYHSPIEKLVCFDYQKGRSRAGPTNFLKDFKGVIQVDGYKAYNIFDDTAQTRLLGCLAHARRKFEQSLKNKKEQAEYALEKIKQLYMIERQATEMTYAQRKELREEQSVPVLNELRGWLEETYKEALPKSAIAVAIGYSLNSWQRLIRYLEDGRYEIDNNWVENAIRPVAIGRKNYLFAGSHDAAQRAAIIYSLLNTCKKNNVEPRQWLQDVLNRITDYPVNQLENLLPNNFTGK